MILNIIDRRKRKYRWREITAIFEPTCHDDNVKDADITYGDEKLYNGIGYHEIEKCSLGTAIQYAKDSNSYLTLYIYDLGEGIKETSK